jgi:hypothetical protein
MQRQLFLCVNNFLNLTLVDTIRSVLSVLAVVETATQLTEVLRTGESRIRPTSAA